ncbi:MAG: hypothetical protein N4A68_14305 [Maledivibacter sp.]|jgi:hypothetical protein|nr:hypothetical protein [Maledivibacter sp.]
MFFNNNTMRKIIKLEEDKNLKKKVLDSIFLGITFGGIFLGLLYNKLQSNLILISALTIMMFFTIWGLVIRRNIKRQQFFLFEGSLAMLVSISCLGLSITIYYLYLEMTSILFTIILLLFYVIFVMCSVLLIKMKLEEKNNKSKIKDKIAIGTISCLGVFSILIGRSLVSKLNQNNLFILLLFLLIIIGYTFEFVANHNLLQYLILKNKLNTKKH